MEKRSTWMLGLLGACILNFGAAKLMAAESTGPKKAQQRQLRTTANCLPASASAQLDINNVRCMLYNGGDMWWDLHNNPRYEIPKVDNPALAKHSAFASSLWIGGMDDDGNLRVAAQTYRQSGNDFYPGPLSETGGVSEAVCNGWDKMYKINKAEILEFRAAFTAAQANGEAVDLNKFPAVKSWPAFGEGDDGRVAMAPFVDVDGNPMAYSPAAGDYPDIRPMEGGGEPDQAIWWVINDKGDIHGQTGGEAIGLEIQMMAFAFATSNAINDMTFYKYKIINKSGRNLNQTYMGLWADVDLGNPADDYVGCDVERGFGYAYNGDADDETAGGYGENPPAFGIDFFQGPKGDNDSLLQMSKFVYYTNNQSLTGEPEVAAHYYGYLRGFWKDGSQMTYGGNGFHGTEPTDFMFPGDPGGCGVATGWSEILEGNPPGDRRFLSSAGPFTLQRGAQNNIIVGAVWARSEQNAQLGSVCELLKADDLAQALFDARFKLLDGPDAPELAIEEYDQELTLNWGYSNPTTFNNFNESYSQVDPALASQNVSDPEFEFQGYMVFQLKDATVSASELFDSERARLIAQCDLKDGVGTIVNRDLVAVPGLPQPLVIDKVMVEGADEGIFHSLKVTEDQFAAGTDTRLVNFREYHYGILAYAYNEIPSDGKQFVQGNRFFRNVSAMPHKVAFEGYGTLLGSIFGQGIPVYQTHGFGNGGMDVQLLAETESAILANGSVSTLGFEANAGPIFLQVVDPKQVKGGNYRLELPNQKFVAEIDTIYDIPDGPAFERQLVEWELYYQNDLVFQATVKQRTLATGEVSYRPQPLNGTRHFVEGHGISIGVTQPSSSGASNFDPVISTAITYTDPKYPWLSGVQDVDDLGTADWILSGRDTFDRGIRLNVLRNYMIYDPEEYYENILNGSFAPMCLARAFANSETSTKISPGVEVSSTSQAFNVHPDSMVGLDELPDIDIVITPDRSKWSRCVVVETSPAPSTGSGANTLAAKWQPGLDENLRPMSTVPSQANQGWSYFPGYAIDVNTGRRLNIFFGESSWDIQNNGNDLLFNPGSKMGTGGQDAGGRHYVYVSNTEYDGCEYIHEVLARERLQGSGGQLVLDPSLSNNAWTNPSNMGLVYKDVAWVGVPMTAPGMEWNTYDEIPSALRLSIRVNDPFRSRPGQNDIPVIEFNTTALAALTGEKEVAIASLLNDVRVVPNPYYAFSKYEQQQLQTIVKLTNLPERCKINIFNLNGTLVRQYDKHSQSPEQTWDLKNQDGVPVAGGVYLLHVDAFELGEIVLKLMVVMPKADLNAY